ncbi:unnamed protein product [Mytilus coruscus]|uniref:Endonuclease/exonuclease/phosphatase domain-containing protein n=1 Tax=Mytilus coruscus TaxID=42192 RepID=A0A6J8EAP9_MYTCO|nr:unnamed protein product [Mytilus coruscus]
MDLYNLKYDNKERTFVNSLGQELSEIDYFLHNLPEGEFNNKQVLNNVTENTSDHHPIRMSTKFTYENSKNSYPQASSNIAKRVNWDKVDKDWYTAHINLHIDSLQIKENMGETAIEQATSKLCELLRETANLTSSSKAKFNAKPKLAWTFEIHAALKIARLKYKVWRNHGRPNNKSNKKVTENPTTIQHNLVPLDAKADTVIHSHMLRRVFMAGIDDGHWGLIKDLHEHAKSAIKWEGNISQPFNVNQGVR